MTRPVATLKTERLILRPWRAEHFAICGSVRRSCLTQYFLATTNRAETQIVVGRIHAQFDAHGFDLWAGEVPGFAPFLAGRKRHPVNSWGAVIQFGQVAIGQASRCFGFVKYWVEKKVRRHLMRARNQRGLVLRNRLRDPLHRRMRRALRSVAIRP